MDNICDILSFVHILEGEKKRMGLDITEKADKAEMMNEAIKRMQMLGLAPEAISDFQSSGKVCFGMEDGQCFPLDASEQARIQWLDDSKQYLTYAVIRNESIFGRMISYLVVGPYKCDWELEHMQMKENIVMAYVYNYDVPDFSELGQIWIECSPGGMLKRTW